MSTYDITLTDPLKSGFTIQPGGFDGPGGSRANTTLRLYGRGALEWGEAVDENLVRLAETFAGSTPPLYPLPGQLWMRVRYYWHDTSAAITAGWWYYDIKNKVWARLNGTGNISDSIILNPTIGSYYYSTSSTTLFRWDTAYKQAGAAWLPRHFSSSNLAGAAPTRQPEQELLVWDQYGNDGDGQWVPPLTVATVAGQPIDPQLGALWYDVTTGKLHIWDGQEWKQILGPTNGSNTSASGDINMENYHITNLADGVIAAGNKDAVNGGTVYSYVTAQINALNASSTSTFLPKAGGTITGNLAVNGTTTLTGAATMGTANITNLVVGSSGGSFGYKINMNNNTIYGVPLPTAAGEVSNKQYVDNSISALSSSLGGVSAATACMVYGGSGAYKIGDICVQGNNVYVAVNAGTTPPPSANWKLIYPAAFL